MSVGLLGRKVGMTQVYDADGVMLLGRVKWHTDFAGKIESGLFKMMAIGLGTCSVKVSIPVAGPYEAASKTLKITITR